MSDFSSTAAAMIGGILKRKDLVIFFGIILLSFAFARNVYQSQTRKLQQIEKSVAQEELKVSVAQEVAGLNKKRAQMSEPYYKSNKSLSSDNLNKLAQSAAVKVILIDEEPEHNFDFYGVSSFKMELRADYHSLGKFISALESLPGRITIEELLLQKEESRLSQAEKGNKKNILKIVLKVSDTFIKK